MLEFADVIVDLQAGDTGKGKVCNYLSQSGEYTHVVRYNGGGNAGHTIYVGDMKIVTHYIPSGIVNGLISIIGPGCVVNINSLMNEIKDLESKGIRVREYLFIDKRVHIITDDHIAEDSKDSKIGTTKTGNGPAYRDKYYRQGIRAEDVEEIRNYVCDIYNVFHKNDFDVRILFEGAQGFELDIDWGDYPYVTSSHCTIGSAVLNGVPPQKIRKVYGVCKAYNTYVGAKTFEQPDDVFNQIREVGNEFGSTTGRPRQIAWTDMDMIIKAANINGVTNMVVNKVDVLEKVGVFKLNYDGITFDFKDKRKFKEWFNIIIRNNCPMVEQILFSESMEII